MVVVFIEDIRLADEAQHAKPRNGNSIRGFLHAAAHDVVLNKASVASCPIG
jgi:hypothetical protein